MELDENRIRERFKKDLNCWPRNHNKTNLNLRPILGRFYKTFWLAHNHLIQVTLLIMTLLTMTLLITTLVIMTIFITLNTGDGFYCFYL